MILKKKNQSENDFASVQNESISIHFILINDYRFPFKDWHSYCIFNIAQPGNKAAGKILCYGLFPQFEIKGVG